MVIRPARPEDGPAIGKLFAAADYDDLGVDWHADGLHAWWLVAARGDEIVGAIQYCAAQPYGFIGDCVVLPSVRARRADGSGRFGQPGRVTLMLYAMALEGLRKAGSQRALGVTKKPGMKRMLARYGGKSLGPTELFVKVLGA